MDIKLPNFLIVGAAKCGTTALYNYLKEHPEIYLPGMKEPRFLAASSYQEMCNADPRFDVIKKWTIFDFESYARLFEQASGYKAVGEATATYLYNYNEAIPNIKKYLNDVRIIISLRDPADRAFSAYSHLVRDGFEHLPFEKCLSLEPQRREKKWSQLNYFKDQGFYYHQVKAYLEAFNRVKICIFDDLKEKPLESIREIYEFLEVDGTFTPDFNTKHNVSLIPKNRFLHNLLDQPSIIKRLLKPFAEKIITEKKRKELLDQLKKANQRKFAITPETKESLRKEYRQDILKVQNLIDRDLSSWLR